MRYLSDKKQFKRANLQGWYRNTVFWLNAKLPHIRDVRNVIVPFIKQKASRGNIAVYDIGCGDAWLLRELRKENLKAKYTGIDFNEKLISELQSQYSSVSTARFVMSDIEAAPPPSLAGGADIAVSCFHFFEVPQLQAGFRNVATMIRRNGFLIVVTIDPVMQILAISKNHNIFLKHLAKYQRYGDRLAYDKHIETAGGVSRRIYKGILYSTGTFCSVAQKHGFVLTDYKEVVRTASQVPQIYQFLFFQKQC